MAFYLVQASLIVKEEDFDPSILNIPWEDGTRRWNVGQYVRENSKFKNKTSGVSYNLLDKVEDPDWCDVLLPVLKKWFAQHKEVIALIPTPMISICVWTGGTDFPPLYFSREFLAVVTDIKAELDVDVITTSVLEKCEEDEEE